MDAILTSVVSNDAKEAEAVLKRRDEAQAFKKIIHSLIDRGLDKIDL